MRSTDFLKSSEHEHEIESQGVVLSSSPVEKKEHSHGNLRVILSSHIVLFWKFLAPELGWANRQLVKKLRRKDAKKDS